MRQLAAMVVMELASEGDEITRNETAALCQEETLAR
jgi:hypothetical protein